MLEDFGKLAAWNEQVAQLQWLATRVRSRHDHCYCNNKLEVLDGSKCSGPREQRATQSRTRRDGNVAERRSNERVCE
jgi:hypothetical protein